MLDSHTGEVKPYPLVHMAPKKQFSEFLHDIYKLGTSDIRIQSNDFVWADVSRRLQRVSERRLPHEEVLHIFRMLLDSSSEGVVNAGQDVNRRVELPITRDNVLEFRANAVTCTVARVKDGLSLILRAIPTEIPTLDRLGIEQVIRDNFFPRYGLILVVGTTGSGKSTLMASSLRYRLEKRRHDPVSILTYENPIEYPLAGYAEGYMPEPSQVEIGLGRHLQLFDQAAPNAMRRKGDVIVAGEVKDLGSASACLEMSRTGHSVLATLHVDTPAQAFDRLVKFYPIEQQQGEAFAILDQLKMVVAQKLARTTAGGKIAFRSWCIFDRALKDRLYDAEVKQWSRMISEHVREDGATFEQVAGRALKAGEITQETFREVSGMTVEEARKYAAANDLFWEEEHA